MDKYLKINEVSKLLGISSYNIRYYEKEGLFKINNKSDKGYRLFSYEDLDVLSAIMMLRDSQIPIKEVKELMDDYSPNKYMDALVKSSDNIDREIKRLSHLKKAVDGLISGYNHSQLGYYTRQEDERWIIPVKKCGFDDELSVREFYDFIIKNNISVDGIFINSLVYLLYNDYLICGLIYDKKDTDIECQKIESGEYICYKFQAMNNEDINEAIEDIIQYVYKNKIEVDENEMVLKELDTESFYHSQSFTKTYEVQIRIK
jgi:DNA-binding transcriptional MerR regulator